MCQPTSVYNCLMYLARSDDNRKLGIHVHIERKRGKVI